jgi:drug/metabolite transporter (DMT)-like permease
LGVIGILFGFAGVALVAAPSAALPSRDMAGWFLLSLVAPLLFASANICAAFLAPREGSTVGAGAGILLGSAFVPGGDHACHPPELLVPVVPRCR